MQKPHIIYHMMTSLDGKVAGDFLLSPCSQALCDDYYRIHIEFKANAFLCGRTTMQGSFTGTECPDVSAYDDCNVAREDYVPFPNEKFYAVAIDSHCRLDWTAPYITDEDPGYDNAYIIEILCENAPDAFLAYLKEKNIAYIFAGESSIDLPLAMHKLKTLFGIDLLLLEGGGITGATFIDAGLVDEYSLVVSPTIQGNTGTALAEGILHKVHTLTLIEQRELSQGVWLHLAEDNKIPADDTRQE